MKPQPTDIGHRKPRMIAERLPIRPVRVAAVREPIKVTTPISFGEPRIVPLRSR